MEHDEWEELLLKEKLMKEKSYLKENIKSSLSFGVVLES